ncbi:MAG: 4-hydroxyphenylpyruvate dioxygenase [uncultured bacterium]|nr:MAG: 4-hydroxyphenylpyruvate dioxygenase [uncultured bacterium]
MSDDDFVGIEGIDFIEFGTNDNKALAKQLDIFGFTPIATHHTDNVVIYQQNDIRFIINQASNSLAQQYADMHGSAISAIGLRVQNVEVAYRHALNCAALSCDMQDVDDVYGVPAIYGIGSSLIYFVEYQNEQPRYSPFFSKLPSVNPKGIGLTGIDHLTYSLRQENIQEWIECYARILGSKARSYVDGEKQSLISLTSKNGLNVGKLHMILKAAPFYNFHQEAYLSVSENEGIEHIAFTAANIPQSIQLLWQKGIEYFANVNSVPELLEICHLSQHHAAKTPKKEILQIFTPTMIGSLFFELIQCDKNVEAIAKQVQELTKTHREKPADRINTDTLPQTAGKLEG